MRTLNYRDIPCSYERCCCPLAELNGGRAQAASTGRPLHLPKKVVVYEQGMPATGVYVACEGRLKLARRTIEGDQQILAIAGPRDLLGVEALFDREDYDHCAQTLEPCRLLYLPKPEFESAMHRFEFSQAVLHQMAKTLRDRQRRLQGVLRHGVRERLIRALRDLSQQYGVKCGDAIEINFNLTNEDWAAWVDGFCH